MKSLSRMKTLHKRNTSKHILKFQNVWQNRCLQNAQVENVYTNNKYSSHKCALAFSNILNTWTHMSYWCPPLFPHTFVNYELIEGMIHILLISVSNLQKSTQAFLKIILHVLIKVMAEYREMSNSTESIRQVLNLDWVTQLFQNTYALY